MEATITRPSAKELMETKLHTLLEERKSKIEMTMNSIESTVIADYVLPTRKFRFDTSLTGITDETVAPSGVYVNFGDLTNIRLHDNAIMQLGERLWSKASVASWLKGLAGGGELQKALAAEVLNRSVAISPNVRTLTRIVDNRAMAFLSDKYRRLNSTEIYAKFLKGINENGGVVVDAFGDDTRTWMEAVLPFVVEIPTKNNGTNYVVFGLRISTSDFGDGALNINAFMLLIVCGNGLVGKSQMREVHLGGRLPDDIQLSKKTYDLDTKTQASITYDMVNQMFKKEFVEKQGLVIQKASDALIPDIGGEIVKLETTNKLTKKEGEAVHKVILNGLEEANVQGKNSLWKLSQAITYVGNQQAQRRKRELEEVAGKLINMN